MGTGPKCFPGVWLFRTGLKGHTRPTNKAMKDHHQIGLLENVLSTRDTYIREGRENTQHAQIGKREIEGKEPIPSNAVRAYLTKQISADTGSGTNKYKGRDILENIPTAVEHRPYAGVTPDGESKKKKCLL